MASKPIVIETRYAAPPEWVAAWLQDFREDDLTRFFGDERGARVQRVGDRAVIQGVVPGLGDFRTEVRLGGRRWTAQGLISRKGKPVMATSIVGTADALPDGGTVHRVELRGEPQAFPMTVVMPLFGRAMMLRRLKPAFARMAEAADAQWRAGQPPAA